MSHHLLRMRRIAVALACSCALALMVAPAASAADRDDSVAVAAKAKDRPAQPKQRTKKKLERTKKKLAAGKGKRRHLRAGRRRTAKDVDGDRIPNGRDRDVDGDRISNRFDDDIDGDRLLNALDRNMDADRRPNASDRDVDGDRRRNTADYDIDADRKHNDYDHDIDGDGVENAWDDDSDSSGDALLGAAGVVSGQPGFVGLTSDDAFWGTDADPSRADTLRAVAGTGVRTLRQAFLWSRIEPSPGRFDFELHDDFVKAAARNGISVLPILFDPPSFHSGRPAGDSTRGVFPPANNGSFAEYAAQLVRRYGPDGSFWRIHPELPELPIRSWQIWNEPNIPFYWGGNPNPGAYAELLKAGSSAIKAVDPGAQIVTAGLNDSELGIKLAPFLEGMYAAGAKDSFDVLALHPYAPASDLVIDQVRRAVSQLQRAGDDARTLVTELGWATSGPAERALVVGEDAQAALIGTTLSRLSRLRTQLRLDGVFYFNWRDVSPAAGARDHWGLHTGLLREDGSQKPAMQALTEATRLVSGG